MRGPGSGRPSGQEVSNGAKAGNPQAPVEDGRRERDPRASNLPGTRAPLRRCGTFDSVYRMKSMPWCALPLAAVFSIGCGGANGPDPAVPDPDDAAVKERASFDFNCQENKIRLRWFDERTAGVRGCGKRATYTKMCNYSGQGLFRHETDCTWVLNSSASSSSDDK